MGQRRCVFIYLLCQYPANNFILVSNLRLKFRVKGIMKMLHYKARQKTLVALRSEPAHLTGSYILGASTALDP